MKDSCDSLTRLRASCENESRCAHVYEDLTQRIARSLAVQVVILSVLGKERYCHRGCDGSTSADLSAAVRVCDIFLISNAESLAIQDTHLDPVFARHPGVIGSPFMRSFAGVRIDSAMGTIGTLCAFDKRPGAIASPLFDDMRRLARAVVLSVHARASSAAARSGSTN